MKLIKHNRNEHFVFHTITSLLFNTPLATVRVNRIMFTIKLILLYEKHKMSKSFGTCKCISSF